MAIKITDECINCGACESECPNTAIYKPSEEWSYSEGTELKGEITLLIGGNINADELQEPFSDDIYFIIVDKCTECIGFHSEPQCAAVCPVDCCILDEENIERESYLLTKKCFLHND